MFYISKNDIDYLKPPSQAEYIQHSSDYIKSGYDQSSKRNIYYGVELDSFEQRHIETLKKEIENAGIQLNKTWVDREILKYIYAAKFDTRKALEIITECLKWRTEVQSLSVTNSALELLYSGAIYTIGRDKQLRPILIINLEKIDIQNANQNDMGMVATFFLDSVKEFALLQGKIENLVLVVDGAGKEFDNAASDKFEYLLKKMIITHPTIVERTYVVNASNSINRFWAKAQSLLEKETVSKVQFISKDELNKLQVNIASDQLETKYGGSITNLTCYWPLCLINVNTNLNTSSLITARPSAKSISISPASDPLEKYVSTTSNYQYSTYSPEPKGYESYKSSTYQFESPSYNTNTEKYVSSVPQYTTSTYSPEPQYTPRTYSPEPKYTTSTYSPEPQADERYTSSSYQMDIPSNNNYEKYVSNSVPQYNSTSYTAQPQSYDKYLASDYQYTTSSPQTYEKYVSSYPQERYTAPESYSNTVTLEYDWKKAAERYSSAAPVTSTDEKNEEKEVEKKEEPKENNTTEEGEAYDFNNDDLLNLIMGENDYLKEGKVTFKTNERESLYRPTEGETEKKSRPQVQGENASENESPAGRETYYTDYSSLRQERERGTLLKSAIFKAYKEELNSPYSGRDTANTDIDSRNMTPIGKGPNDKNYLKAKKTEEEETEEEMSSWGFCVSSRKKEKKAQAAN